MRMYTLIMAEISIHALLAESDMQVEHQGYTYKEFLSTLSLRRATRGRDDCTGSDGNFYPRSPCGERHVPVWALRVTSNFYPRSPCGERQLDGAPPLTCRAFLSTLSLRRATSGHPETRPSYAISIHALLAESDAGTHAQWPKQPKISIHALLAESDFKPPIKSHGKEHFYPRSPCGERRDALLSCFVRIIFLSTLSLRRATWPGLSGPAFLYNFYPRSPCGERHVLSQPSKPRRLFLSTLSLRRATARTLSIV